MANAWETAKVFAALLSVIALIGWGVWSAFNDPSLLTIAFLIVVAAVVLAVLWYVASWIAFVIGGDW